MTDEIIFGDEYMILPNGKEQGYSGGTYLLKNGIVKDITLIIDDNDLDMIISIYMDTNLFRRYKKYVYECHNLHFLELWESNGNDFNDSNNIDDEIAKLSNIIDIYYTDREHHGGPPDRNFIFENRMIIFKCSEKTIIPDGIEYLKVLSFWDDGVKKLKIPTSVKQIEFRCHSIEYEHQFNKLYEALPTVDNIIFIFSSYFHDNKHYLLKKDDQIIHIEKDKGIMSDECAAKSDPCLEFTKTDSCEKMQLVNYELYLPSAKYCDKIKNILDMKNQKYESVKVNLLNEVCLWDYTYLYYNSFERFVLHKDDPFVSMFKMM